MIDAAKVAALITRLHAGERLRTALAAEQISYDEHMALRLTSREYRLAIDKALAEAQARLERSVYEQALDDPALAQRELARRDPIQHSERVAAAMVAASAANEGIGVVDLSEAREALDERRKALGTIEAEKSP